MTRRLIVWAVVGSALLAASLAQADEFPEKKPYVGLYGGYNAVVQGWDLGKDAVEDDLEPGSSLTAGLRLGYQLMSRVGLEFNLGWLPVEYSDVDESTGTALIYSIDALYHLTPAKWAPFVLAGGGATHLLSDAGDAKADLDPQFHAGLGVRGLITPWLAARAQARYVMSDGFGDAPSGAVEIVAGVDLFPAGVKKVVQAVMDRDGDTVADADDKCPDVKGLVEMAGCPDGDMDGITDTEDQCPDVAGKAALAGCPDADDDGITDASDKCPQAAGKPELGGCPDADSDGITDAEDKCPQQAGKPELGGCPDGDGDGITDAEDKCPTEAGVPALQGCPDRDRDGIADADDACPDQAGVPDLKGCLPEEVKKYTGAIKGIQFDTNSTKIKKPSYKALDAAIALLQQYPSLRLRIEGHTDNVGKPEFNLELSKGRAQAVKDYMVSKGIDAARLESEGYGDTKPVGDNKKAAGRAQNRRIEFSIVGQ